MEEEQFLVGFEMKILKNLLCISILTKPWNDCENPIIREDLIKFDSNYIDFINKNKES